MLQILFAPFACGIQYDLRGEVKWILILVIEYVNLDSIT